MKSDPKITVKRLSSADIKREMLVYETEYGMTSAQFEKRYRSGEYDGTRDFVDWIGLCHLLAASRTPRSRAASK